MSLNALDTKQLTRRSKGIIEPGDLYLKGFSVYRVMVYNIDRDSVLMGTTNDPKFDQGFTPKKELRKQGFYLCPLELREPAIQVFELDAALSADSMKILNDYRMERADDYKKYKLDIILAELNISTFRVYDVPTEQSARYSWMDGKKYQIPVPFYAIGRHQMRKRINSFNGTYVAKVLKEYKKWPIFYIPRHYETH